MMYVEQLANRTFFKLTLEMLEQIKNGTLNNPYIQDTCLKQNGYYESDIVIHMVDDRTVVLRYYQADDKFNRAYKTIIGCL